jgi:hypothetical protein
MFFATSFPATRPETLLAAAGGPVMELSVANVWRFLCVWVSSLTSRFARNYVGREGVRS